MSILIGLLLAGLLVFLLIRLLCLPIKWGFKLLLNGAAGFVLLFVFNFIGSWLNLSIPVNWFTAILTGLLGVPGLLLLLVAGLFL